MKSWYSQVKSYMKVKPFCPLSPPKEVRVSQKVKQMHGKSYPHMLTKLTKPIISHFQLFVFQRGRSQAFFFFSITLKKQCTFPVKMNTFLLTSLYPHLQYVQASFWVSSVSWPSYSPSRHNYKLVRWTPNSPAVCGVW